MVVFSPLAQGILSGKYLQGIPEGSRAARPEGFLRPAHISVEMNAKVERLAEIAQKREQTLSQMALAWVAARPFVTSVILGVRSSIQLDENLAALKNLAFSPEELARIDAICGIG